MFNEYKELCRKNKINLKKDATIVGSVSAIILLIAIAMMFVSSSVIALAVFLCIPIYYLNHISSLKSNLRQITNAKEIAFNSFYRYTITLINNGNVLYSALQKSLEYVDEVLIDDVNELIANIENDTSLEPFITFMDNFTDENIKQMIMLLYKTQEAGNIEDVIERINECMVNFQDTSINNYIKKEEKKVEKYYIFPIIFSAAILILFTFYVFTMIGEGLYV